MKKVGLLTGAMLGLGPIAAAWLLSPTLLAPARSGIGTAANLTANYQEWLEEQKQQGGDAREVVRLGWHKGLSTMSSEATGTVKLDFGDGLVTAEATGLPNDTQWDLWLIDNQEGAERTIMPEPGDKLLRVGTLTGDGATLHLSAQIGADTLRHLDPDLYAVTHAGRSPVDDRVLLGTTSLFQKLHREELLAASLPRGATPQTDNGSESSSLWSGVLGFFGSSAQAEIGPVPNAGTTFQQLVEAGRKSFFNEKFNGNGRTCGTCHRENNNLTIDPKFIATLPPNDPLFVAETNPALSRNFEDPDLMRRFGLIKENVDGFEDLERKFVMRGVPHTLALIDNSLRPSKIDNTTTIDAGVTQRTGWGGDGAPGTGTLKEFIIGAVVQHYPKTLGRKAGVDFRLPTEAELNALEAFQKSLGRRQDPKLIGTGALRLKAASAARGQQIFNNLGTFPAPGAPVPPGAPTFNQPNQGAGKCLACHFNAGAGDLIEALFTTGVTNPALAVATTNANFDTGVEDLSHPAGPGRLPPDGGFGRERIVTPDGRFLGFGSATFGRSFNVPPVVEAADTVPLMHNNSIATIEEAVRFYTLPEFANSPVGRLTGPIELSAGQVQDVAAFLRVINALENVRSSRDLVRRATQTGNLSVALTLIRLAGSEIDDALEVLGARGLNLGAITFLSVAKTNLAAASINPLTLLRNLSLNTAVANLDLARADMAF